MSWWSTIGQLVGTAGEFIGGLVRGSKSKSDPGEPVEAPPEDTHEEDNRSIEERIRRGEL